MILIVDNYDSFVYNLARYVREAGREVVVVRNDASTVDELVQLDAEGVILSPGPKTPKDAGVCLSLLAMLPETTPVLGVCLGHQCIAEAHGGRTIRARNPLHGEASSIRHDGSGLFAGLPSPFLAGRYHSLIADVEEGGSLIANAWCEQGEIMGLRIAGAPRHGVQFHPESLLTPLGRTLVLRFLALAGAAP
jgi:anthranilate synthase/aminodeoxychorismate synthase-like glutamine amidotransferase